MAIKWQQFPPANHLFTTFGDYPEVMKLEPLQIIRSIGHKELPDGDGVSDAGYLAEHFSAYELCLIQRQGCGFPED